MNNFSFLITVGAFIVLSALLFFILTRFESTRERAKAKLTALKTNLFWNGMINIIRVDFLPLSAWLAAFIIVHYRLSDHSLKDNLLLSFCIYSLYAFLMGFIVFFLAYSNNQYVNLKYFDRINNLTEGINLEHRYETETIKKLKKMRFVNFLLERFCLAMASAIFYGRPTF